MILPGISDASLNRLLVTLLEEHYIEKNEDGLYKLSYRVSAWKYYFKAAKNIKNIAEQFTRPVAEQAEESVAMALYNGEFIEIINAIDYPDSISVIKRGHVLHYESDHAASLAILNSLHAKERIKALNSNHSYISSNNEYENGIRRSLRGYYFCDESRSRIGVSRIAVPFKTDTQLGALFLCLPTRRLEKDEYRYAEILAKTRESIESLVT